MSDETYNGYTNYETWNLMLWLMNDEGYYDTMDDRTPKVGGWDVDDLKQFCMEDLLPDGTPDFDSPNDYKKVNWEEIRDGINEAFVVVTDDTDDTDDTE